MRHYILFLMFCIAANVTAGNVSYSSKKSFRISKNKTQYTETEDKKEQGEIKSGAPNLNIVPNSVKFIDEGGSNTINAGKTSRIRLKIKNEGNGTAYGCSALIKASGATEGLSFAPQNNIEIQAGEVKDIEFPITAGLNTIDSIVSFEIQINEPNGFGTDPVRLDIKTRKFLAPNLKIVDHTVTADRSGVLQKKKPFDLQLLLQNTQHGEAEDVSVSVVIPEGVFIMDGSQSVNIKAMEGGAKKSLVYSLIVNNNYKDTVIPIRVNLKERFGKYAESKTINLQLNQTLASNKIVVDAKERSFEKIQLASLSSDVDKNIPVSPVRNENTFVAIVANENYKMERLVPYALSDGRKFAEYCEKTLGINPSHIKVEEDATAGTIRGLLNWLKGIASSYGKESKIIFYYAGHGAPDINNQTAYILPSDGTSNDLDNAINLNDFYAELGAMNSASVTVFLDACFSGSSRDGNMISSLANSRGLAVEVEGGNLSGNMVVFSATKSNETANPYEEEGHGMFTYFLLKKLQESAGNVSYKDMSEYVTKEVSRKSSVMSKTQTPTVSASENLGDTWENWTFK